MSRTLEARIESIGSERDAISAMGPTGAIQQGPSAVIAQMSRESMTGFEGWD